MRTDKYDNAILTVTEGRQALLNGRDISGIYIDDGEEVNRFCHNSERVLGRLEKIFVEPMCTMSPEMYHAENASRWNIPKEYKDIDVKEYLLGKCLTDAEEERVKLEYSMFEERGLIPLLQFLIYIVDYMRQHKIVWGVGRGSSVASYSLYLLGVHKVNSLKYELPIEEFLK